MSAEYFYTRDAVIEELSNLALTFSPGLARALWSLENDLIRSTIQGILKNPIVVGVKIVQKDTDATAWEEGIVFDDHGQVKYNSGGQNHDLEHMKMASELIVYPFDIVYTTQKGAVQTLATATLYSSRAIVIDKVKFGFMFILINALIKTGVLWYLFLWGSNRFVAEPLIQFTKKLENMNVNKLLPILLEDNTLKDTELDSLTKAFNTMIFSLNASLLANLEFKEKLKKSSEFLKSVIDFMPSMLIYIDDLNCVTHWNKTAENITQVSAKEVIGLPIITAFPYLKEYVHLIDQAKETGAATSVSKIRILVKEEVRYIDILIYPLNKNFETVIVKVDDITDRIRIENSMMRTEKMSSLGILAAGMAHELNNPLSSILQGLENSQRRLEPENMKNIEIAEQCQISLCRMRNYMESRGILTFLEGARKTATRAGQIVRHVLTFVNQGTVYSRSTAITHIMEQAFDLLKVGYEEENILFFNSIQFIREYQENLPLIGCYPVSLEQALLNILKNAVYAVWMIGQQRTAVIHIRIQQQEHSIVVEIQDNGCGIPEDIQAKIFDPFFTTRNTGLGSGLGLSTAYFIISDTHRGKIEVQSVPEEGSLFRILLPIDLDIV
jgi:PAS domain S-box-containing protein